MAANVSGEFAHVDSCPLLNHARYYDGQASTDTMRFGKAPNTATVCDLHARPLVPYPIGSDLARGVTAPVESVINATRKLRHLWTIYRLANCTAVVVSAIDGRTYEPAWREAASLNVTRSWLHWLFLCVHWLLTWFVSDIVELHVHSIAGRGLRARDVSEAHVYHNQPSSTTSVPSRPAHA